MIKIRELEKVVSILPPKELSRFRNWFVKFDSGDLKQFKEAIEKIRRGKKTA